MRRAFGVIGICFLGLALAACSFATAAEAAPAIAAMAQSAGPPGAAAAGMAVALGVAGLSATPADDTAFGAGISAEEVERIAGICHEANRAWCEYQGDTSQPAWADAPDWQRQSAINGVAFTLSNPDAGDSASHENWTAEKMAAGWVYGEVKDPNASPPTHPCLVAFEDLPPEQQFKDRLFRTIVLAAAA